MQPNCRHINAGIAMKLKDKVFGLGQSSLGGVALALLIGCSASPTTPEISHDGLVLQDDTKFGLVYAKPGVDIRDYENFAVHHCTVAFRKNWQRDQNSTRRSTSRRILEKRGQSRAHLRVLQGF